MAVIGIGILAINCKHRNVMILDQIRSHIILRTQRIRCTEKNVRTARFQCLHETCRFRGNMKTGTDSPTLQGLFFRKPISNTVQNRHALVGPGNTNPALIGKGYILNIVIHY